MSEIRVSVSHAISASPDAVYAVLSDYLEGHPAILPKPYFTNLEVIKGGRGDGTVLRVGMQVFGVRREYHLVVSEPEPGRVLAEVDSQAGVRTMFTVEPLDGGGRSRVTITTHSPASPGFTGWVERLVNPVVTRRIYRQELAKLEEYMRRKAVVRPASPSPHT